MKIVPVTLLKPVTKAVIDGFETQTNESVSKAITRLQAIGFVPGREVEFRKHYGRLYLLKIGSDNPFALDKSLAEKILVSAEEGDAFVSYKESRKATSIIADIKKLFSKLKGK